MRNLSISQAMNEALREEMRRDPAVYVVGLGLYPSTDDSATSGLVDEFGEQRVRCDTAGGNTDAIVRELASFPVKLPFEIEGVVHHGVHVQQLIPVRRQKLVVVAR